MVKYRVTRIVEFAQEVDAETPEEALAGFDPAQATPRIVREGAKVPRGQPRKGATTDRELRPGRRFTAKRKGRRYTALVKGPQEIEVAEVDGDILGTYPTMNKAAMAIVGGPVNAWALFRDAPAEGAEPEPEPVTEDAPPPPPRKKAKKGKKAK